MPITTFPYVRKINRRTVAVDDGHGEQWMSVQDIRNKIRNIERDRRRFTEPAYRAELALWKSALAQAEQAVRS